MHQSALTTAIAAETAGNPIARRHRADAELRGLADAANHRSQLTELKQRLN